MIFYNDIKCLILKIWQYETCSTLRFCCMFCNFGTSGRHFSWSAFWWSTGNDVSGHYKHHYFLFLFSVVYFSHRRSALIKKLILRKLLRLPKNLGVDTFPDPVGHFGAHWRPFWVLQAVRRCRR